MFRHLMPAAAALTTLLSIDASGQTTTDPRVLPPTERLSLEGPRFGFTILSPGIVDTLAAHGVDVSPFITQFGWQIEHQFYAHGPGPTMVTELVGLLGALEQGEVLPSGSWIVGVRSPNGAEVGLGPNFSAAGPALVLAAGITRRVGAVNIPLNVSIVPSKTGTRVSFLGGYTMRRGVRARSDRAQRIPRFPGSPRIPLPVPSTPIEPQIPHACFPNAQLCNPPIRVPMKPHTAHAPARVESVGVCWSQHSTCRRPAA